MSAPQMQRHMGERAKFAAFLAVTEGAANEPVSNPYTLSPGLLRAARPYRRCRARIIINREMGRK